MNRLFDPACFSQYLLNTQNLACNKECAFFTSDVYNNHNLWSCQKVCDALVYLLDNILLDLELNFIDKLLYSDGN